MMGNYEQALSHAEVSYKMHNVLLDYNKLNLAGDAVFDRNNVEILFMSAQKGYSATSIGQFAPNTFVDSEK